MRLLVITQKVDSADPVLGFFHGWLVKLAPQFEKVTTICLEFGQTDLPANVKVSSLGKEAGRSRFKYLGRFFKYLWQERNNYDAVLVHMNQEYILLAGWWWHLTGKPVFMWRNHHAGNWLTDLAAWFCTKVFCTSKYSYTAKYQKTVLMPVGVDLDLFKSDLGVVRIPDSILFLGRVAPAKNTHIFVEAVGQLKEAGIDVKADIVGDTAPIDQDYAKRLNWPIKRGVPNRETPRVYAAYEVYVNLSSSGMYDKTIFEAMACGCLALVSNKNLVGQIDERLIISEEKTAGEVAQKIKNLLKLAVVDKQALVKQQFALVQKHGLAKLVERLVDEIKN